jgi:hypothetical protein
VLSRGNIFIIASATAGCSLFFADCLSAAHPLAQRLPLICAAVIPASRHLSQLLSGMFFEYYFAMFKAVLRINPNSILAFASRRSAL